MSIPLAITLPIILSQPWWLGVAGLAIVPILLAWRARRKSHAVAISSVALQTLALAAAALALAAPKLQLGTGTDQPYLILRDVSASTRGQNETALPFPAELPRETWRFASGVARRGGAIDDGATYLGPVLRAAAAEAGAGGNAKKLAGIIIHTDGHFQDEWEGAASALGNTNVTIVPMESPSSDVRVTDFTATRDAVGGRNIDLKLSIASNAPRSRTVSIYRRGGGDAPIFSRTETALGPMTIRVNDSVNADEAAVYRATLTPSDAISENDSATLVVLPVRRRVAVVASGDSALIDRTLAESQLSVKRIDAANAPTDAAGWASYAAVILADASGKLLSEPSRRGLGEYVQAGGGLLVLGAGPHDTAADRGDPLNQALPLIANPYDRKPMAVTVVLDASGSMAQRGVADGRSAVKFDIAVNAVGTLLSHLTPADTLTVITFSDKARSIYHGPVRAENAAELHEALSQQQPAGPTDIGPALLKAAQIQPPEGTTGLIVVLSDLETKDFKPQLIADALRETDQFLAVVATRDAGSDVPTGENIKPLQYLAYRLNERAEIRHSASLDGLARIFASFVHNRRGSDIRTGHFPLTADRKCFGTDISNMPPATSYVLSALQPKAELLAKIDADPVLARQHLGLGRSVCLALDVTGKSNTDWNASQATAPMLSTALRWCLRPENDPRFRGRAEWRQGRMRFVLDAHQTNRPMNSLEPTLVIRPAGANTEPKRLDLSASAPGQYETETQYPSAAFTLQVVDAKDTTLWQGAFARTCAPEFAATGVNMENLRRLAELTGGKIIQPNAMGNLSRRWGRARHIECWPFAAALALLLTLVDWATTRTWKRWQ